ncbi:hypothetical protein BH11PSE11_BH11PSE11_04860 [soil metagenome]
MQIYFANSYAEFFLLKINCRLASSLNISGT